MLRAWFLQLLCTKHYCFQSTQARVTLRFMWDLLPSNDFYKTKKKKKKKRLFFNYNSIQQNVNLLWIKSFISSFFKTAILFVYPAFVFVILSSLVGCKGTVAPCVQTALQQLSSLICCWLSVSSNLCHEDFLTHRSKNLIWFSTTVSKRGIYP